MAIGNQDDGSPVRTSPTINRSNFVYEQLSTQEICLIFNKFLLQFERMENSTNTTIDIFLNAVEQVANTVLDIMPQKLLDSRVLYHPLMQFLQQMLTDFMKNWQASQLRLNIQETDIFLKIVLIFVHIAEQADLSDSDGERIMIRDLLATRSFLSLVRRQILDNSKYKSGMSDDPNICTLGLLTIKLLQGCSFFSSTEHNSCLIDDLIICCIDSYDYLEALRHLQYGQPLTEMDHFLLFTCWEYIPFLSTNLRYPQERAYFIDLSQHLYDQLFNRLEYTLNEAPLPTPALTYILERYCQLLQIPDLVSCDKHANYIINYLSNILQILSPTKSKHHTNISLALQTLYHLVNRPYIRSLIRKRHLTSLFNKYTSSDTPEQIRQLAFAILAQIIDEQDINKNPTHITAAFLDQLTQLHPDIHNAHLDTTLASLRVLMQHEQIKNEFVSQGGLTKLVQFVRDGDPKKQSAQQLEDVLKIIWSCTFNNHQVLEMLRQDTEFMERVNELIESAKQDGNSRLEKAGEGVVWKVVKEEKFEQEQQEKENKFLTTVGEQERYDCLLSYSWFDMDLAHRIFHHLTDKLGYKVWLDQDQVYGSTIETTANAVENSQFILMCMSETYKRGTRCRSEAEYAFKRKKDIIPIKMVEDYTADGWLNVIQGSKMYIDFGKYDFDKAMVLLDSEMQSQTKKRKETESPSKTELITLKITEDPMEAEGELSKRKKPKRRKVTFDCVKYWNRRKVREFLLKNNLLAMIPVCDGMNGEELFSLYNMCKRNSACMFRSIKFELLHGHHRILPISTYVRFLSHMRVICNDELPFNLDLVRKTCENYSSNSE